MRIPADCQIERIISTDVTREHLAAGAYYEPERKRIAATDGHMLVCVPVKPDPEDHEGYISAEALKSARQTFKKRGADPQIIANGSQSIPGGPTFPRPGVGKQFPPIELTDNEGRRTFMTKTKVKIDRVTIERDAVEVDLPEKCPACGESFVSDEEVVNLRETQLMTSIQACNIVDGEVANHDSYEDFAEDAPVVGYSCACGHELANEEHYPSAEACNAACGDACNGDPDSFLHHSNRVAQIAGALRVVRTTLGKREDSSDVEQALVLLEHFLHVSDIDLDGPETKKVIVNSDGESIDDIFPGLTAIVYPRNPR